jgi:hypothetical protein
MVEENNQILESLLKMKRARVTAYFSKQIETLQE